jgi:hypothetical protein
VVAVWVRDLTIGPAPVTTIWSAYHRIHDGPSCGSGEEFEKPHPKPAWRQLIPSPSHRIMNANEQNPRHATFTPLTGRHHFARRRMCGGAVGVKCGGVGRWLLATPSGWLILVSMTIDDV